jgi:hypothetical protein
VAWDSASYAAKGAVKSKNKAAVLEGNPDRKSFAAFSVYDTELFYFLSKACTS